MLAERRKVDSQPRERVSPSSGTNLLQGACLHAWLDCHRPGEGSDVRIEFGRGLGGPKSNVGYLTLHSPTGKALWKTPRRAIVSLWPFHCIADI